LVLETTQKLPLCILDHPQFVLTLPDSSLPPPVIVLAHDGGFGGDVIGPPEIVLHVDEVVADGFGDSFFLGDVLGIKFV
jgi:hypothetical protein